MASPTTQHIDVLEKFSRYFHNPHIVHCLIAAFTIPLDPPGLELALADLFPDEPAA